MSLHGEDKAIAAIEGKREELAVALSRTIVRQSIELQAHIKRDKLSGQVLRRRTGRLSRSIQYHAPVQREGVVIADVSAGGTNVRYARIHEFGGDIYPVRAKMLRFKIDGRWVFSRHVRMPERSYMRTALAERRPEIVTAVRETARRVLAS